MVWPIPTPGACSDHCRSPTSSMWVWVRPAISAWVVQACPLAGTYCRSSAQIGQTSGSGAVVSTPHVAQLRSSGSKAVMVSS